MLHEALALFQFQTLVPRNKKPCPIHLRPSVYSLSTVKDLKRFIAYMREYISPGAKSRETENRQKAN